MHSRVQTRMHRQLQRDCGLALADYDVLVALSEHGPLRVGDLAALLSWEQSRLSHQLRRMRGRGLVLRRESDEDRRSATVELTAAGHTKLAAAAPGHAALVRATVFDGIPVAQLRAFGEVAATVVGRLG
nr:MAG: MarR family transcriptional regulator [Mycolicibacterium hassiacum]